MTTAVISFDGFFGKGVSIINITNKRKGFTTMEYVAGGAVVLAAVFIVVGIVATTLKGQGGKFVGALGVGATAVTEQVLDTGK